MTEALPLADPAPDATSPDRPATSGVRLGPAAVGAFLLPGFAMGLMAAPVSAILPTFYAKYTTLGLATIGVVLLATRVIDAVGDQVVGYLSDTTRRRWGGRRAWMLLGAIVSAAASVFLFNPPHDAAPAYLFISLAAYYLGWTLITVPHTAWASELTGDHAQRARIFSLLAAVGPIGAALMFGVSLLPAFRGGVTPASMAFMGWVVVAAMPLCCLPPALLTPGGMDLATRTASLKGLVQSLTSNLLFWWFIAYALIAAISLGVVSTLIVFYLDNFLHVAGEMPIVFISNMAVLIASIPLWLKIMDRFGKHRALAAASGFQALLYPVLLLIGPGPNAFLYFFIWVNVLAVAGAALAIAPRAILADIIDYDTWKTGGSRAGNYYAFLGLTEKAVGGLGGAIALFLLLGLGFEPKATQMTEQSRFALLFTMGLFPSALSFIVFLLVWTFPLNARRHAILRRRIEQRAARAARAS